MLNFKHSNYFSFVDNRGAGYGQHPYCVFFSGHARKSLILLLKDSAEAFVGRLQNSLSKNVCVMTLNDLKQIRQSGFAQYVNVNQVSP